MASDDQRQDYEKHGASDTGGRSHLEGARGGGSGSSGGTGPTGSSRSYPKGKSHHYSTDWNPQKCKASTYGIDGV